MNIPISAESDFHQPWSMTVTVTPRSSATLATTRGSRTRPAPGSCASATAAGEASSAILRLVTLDVVHRPHESLVQIDLGLPPARLEDPVARQDAALDLARFRRAVHRRAAVASDRLELGEDGVDAHTAAGADVEGLVVAALRRQQVRADDVLDEDEVPLLGPRS